MTRTRRGPLAALVALTMVLAACGTAGEIEDPDTDAEPDAAETEDEPAEDVDD